MPVQIHGKEYYTVVERMKMMLQSNNQYSIETELIKMEAGIIVMKATLKLETGTYVGHAMEEIGSSQINKTSALENAETSAIGRALSSAGYFGTEFCSANELETALHQQEAPVKNTPNVAADVQDTSTMYIVNFGKHKGKEWKSVPKDYIDWLISKGSVEWQKEEAKAEVERRNKPTKMVGGMSEFDLMEKDKLEEIPF